MGLGGEWSADPFQSAHLRQADQVIHSALDAGINVFDHADIYTLGKAEAVFGEVLKASPHLRDRMIVQSKCAIRFEDEDGPKRYDFSPEWITHSVEQSLTRLNTEYLDLLLLHRPDPLMDAEAVGKTLSNLNAQGKVRHIGVSNMNHHQIAFLQQFTDLPIIANQLEMSLTFRDWVEDGMTTGSVHNRDSGYAPGTLEYCMRNNVQIQAWGSLAQGRLSGSTPANQAEQQAAELVSQLADKYSATREAIVLGWLMRHPANIQPVIGTTNPDRISACAKACDITLSRGDWYQLLETVRGTELP